MELFEEAKIRAVEKADIIDSVTHHYKTVKTDIDIKTGIFVGIEPRGFKNVGMRGAARHDFYPTDMLANAATLAAALEAGYVHFC